MSLEPGTLINDKYQVIEHIGKGAYCMCYKVARVGSDDDTDDQLEEFCAMKLIIDPEKNLKDEFIILNDIGSHPNVVVYDELCNTKLFHKPSQEDKDHDFVTLELMQNGDLFKYATNGGFDEKCARKLLIQVLDGIDHIHHQGYAHLDIKLGNILMTDNYTPKLTDFGFTQRIDSDAMLSSLEFKGKGTRHYMCPEMHQEETFNGKAADIFALGVCFFILLIGDYPFNSAQTTDVKYKNFCKKDPSVFWKKHARAKKRIAKGLISPEFVDLITHMLMPKYDQRFTSEDIRSHCWFNGPIMADSEIAAFFDEIKAAKSS